jgi:Carboxypeptidase regulatory-like domain
MLIRIYLRFLTLSILATTAIFSLSIAASAQSVCNNFVNICTVPGSLTVWNTAESLLGMTGETNEPPAHSLFTNAENPLETVWFHWTAQQSGFVTVDTQGTNPSALGPGYLLPYVVDTTIAVYTGSTLATLTRISESNNWAINSPPDSNCTVARAIGESFLSSCMKFFVVAGTTYHFQLDKLSASDPLNNNTFFRFRLVVPTAANSSISGRVTNDSGRGISRSIVTLTDANGNERSATTNPFGYYRFAEVESGQNYVLQVKRKGYRFQNNPRVLNVNEDLAGEDFIPIGATVLKVEIFRPSIKPVKFTEN